MCYTVVLFNLYCTVGSTVGHSSISWITCEVTWLLKWAGKRVLRDNFGWRTRVSERYSVSVAIATVPLNYNFTFTRVSTRVTTHGSRGRCQNLPWKGSFPRDGPWLFHAKTRGISRHVAFPRNESWNFHETSYRGISRGIFTRPVIVALKSQWLVKAFAIRNWAILILYIPV